MAQFKVTSVSFNLLAEPPSHTPLREEIVDTRANSLFKDCATIQEVEITYEAFWNYLNGPNCVHNPAEKVKVLSVEPV